jgi:ABC transporter substrate binding protein (PQQ-dependent alcohol dehydrogenase system)
MKLPKTPALLLASLLCFANSASAVAQVDVTIGYLEKKVALPPILYNLEEIPEDEGLAGVRLAMKDNATTGKFLKHNYALEEVIVAEEDDVVSAARTLLAKARLLVIKAPASDLLAIADLPEAVDAVLINAGSADVELRDDACRANVLHTLPSRDMVSDALAQFSLFKKWETWVLIHGTQEGDKSLKAALEKSATKFGLTIAGTKEWAFDADMRRNAAQEVPLFTQDFEDHDLLIVADEIGDFGRYVLYNTWLPRPVAGSEGLVASGWSPSVEANGAVQLQNRFRDAARRGMTSIDYAAWAGVRTFGEAVTRLNKADPQAIRAYVLSPEFELAAFKGAPLSFRDWNGQLRQPIPLSHQRALAALAPLDGFLHERTPLDTLGLDKPESKCTRFGG